MTPPKAKAPPKFETVAISSLLEYPGNPRIGDVEGIRESIRMNGLRGVLVVQRSTRFVLSGNQTMQAAVLEGITEVDVKWEDVDDDTAWRIVLVFNRAADLAYYDTDALAEFLGDDPTEEALLGTLYSLGDVRVMLDAVGAGLGGGDDDTDAGAGSSGGGGGGAPADVRAITLPMPVADYDVVIEGFVALRQAWGFDTNAAVLLQLVTDGLAGLDA